MRHLSPFIGGLIILAMLGSPVMAQRNQQTNTPVSPLTIIGPIVTNQIIQGIQQSQPTQPTNATRPTTNTQTTNNNQTTTPPANTQTTRPQPAPQTQTRPQPVRQIVYREVPLPIPRPELREVPYPVARPMLTLGRAAIVDAPYEAQVIVVMVERNEAGNTIRAIMADFGFEYLTATPLDLLGVSLAKFRLPEGMDPEQATILLAGDPRALSVQPNYLYEVAQSQSADMMRNLQYAPQKLDLAQAHVFSTGEGIKIGLIDTAVDPAQPELSDAILDRLDVLGGDPLSRDHGTAMGGLITAHSMLDGVAPDVELVSVRAFDEDQTGKVSSSSFALAEAIDKAIGEGVDLLNFSFAGPRDPLVLKVVDRLEELDLPIIAAAGNNGPDAPPVYPAAHRHAVAVTATNNKDEAFAGANLGMYVEIAAPGVDILSPAPGDRYRLETGTSVATAHVTGIAALVLAINPQLTSAELRAILLEASRDLGAPGRDEVYGAGLIDAARAVELAAS